MGKVLATVLMILLVATGGGGQELDPVTKWATMAFNEFHVSSNIVYQRANNVSLKLDLIVPTLQNHPFAATGRDFR